MGNFGNGSTQDEPPRYTRTLSAQFMGRQPTLRDDGRLDIDIDSHIAKLLPSPPNPNKGKSSQIPPPAYTPQTPQAPALDAGSFPVKLNIVIQVVGSRGDVQPFVALGNELQKHGHRVRLATHNIFDSFVRDAGLEFYPIGGDPAELMAYMVRNPGLIPSMQSLRAGDIKKKRIMVSEMLRGCWLSCINPDPVSFDPFVADAIIANPPSFAHVHCAQALGIPLHMMFTMPWTSTAAFPHPLVNIRYNKSTESEMTMANYYSYGVVEFLTWQGLGDVINEWRASLDLEAIPFSEGPRLVEKLDIPFTYCWSPALVPKPQDWSSNIDVCGFFFREPSPYTPPQDLADFLRDGPPPIYIGFGSIVIDDPKGLSSMLLEAVRTTGTRALISRGWSKLDGPEDSQVMFLGDCPHEWLFQQVTAVIHHGGAGTTACGLVNGRPTTIVPFFGDQPFWGNMVAAAGAGPAPIPQKLLTVEKLVDAIRYCLTPEAARAAQVIAEKMRSERGVEQAVASFHANLPRHLMECEIIKGQPAAWSYSRRGTKIRLSKIAVEILLSHLKVDIRKLQPLETRRIVIENRRWDPFSGTIAAAFGVASDLAKAAADTVIQPVRIVNRHRDRGGDVDIELGQADSSQRGSTTIHKPEKSRGCLDTTKSVTIATAAGMGSCLAVVASSAATIPFAFTEGLRCVPRFWGQEVRDYGEIRDWKSGALAGGQVLVLGLYDGVTGLVMQPYQGAKEAGWLGGIMGFGKGLGNLYFMVFTAAMGMGSYPLMGVYKSVWFSFHCKTRHSVELARLLEGRYLADRGRAKGAGDQVVMEAWEAWMLESRHRQGGNPFC